MSSESDPAYWGRFHALQDLECLMAARVRAVQSARADAEGAGAQPSAEYLAAKIRVFEGMARLLAEARERSISSNEWRHAMTGSEVE